MNKPNIVYLLLDDLGPYELSCLGHPTLETPNLDRLIQSGMRFENAYSGAPVCAPARSALMTGQHTGHTSVRGNLGGIPLLKEDFTAAQMLKDAGYATGGFGKWGCGDAGTDGAPEKHGFDLFYGYYHQVHAHTYFTDYLWRNGERVDLEEGAYSQYLIHDEAKRFIRQNQDRPFFCYLPYTPPHGRFEIPDSDPGWAQYRDRPWEEGPRRRAAMISMVDRHAGEILDLLDELNLTENTLLLFASDNGGGREFNDFFKPNREMKGAKGNLYEGGIRVPFAARWPGRIEPNSVCAFPDLFPGLSADGGRDCRRPAAAKHGRRFHRAFVLRRKRTANGARVSLLGIQAGRQLAKADLRRKRASTGCPAREMEDRADEPRRAV